jgi:hypothetical protein
MLDFSKIAAAGRRTHVQFGEAGDLYFRAMSARQRVALVDAFRAKSAAASAADNLEFQIAVIKATACDEAGNLIMDDLKIEALYESDALLLQQISDAAMRAASLLGDDKVKNSEPATSVASPSV